MNAHVAAERAESAGVSGDGSRPFSGGDGVGSVRAPNPTYFSASLCFIVRASCSRHVVTVALVLSDSG